MVNFGLVKGGELHGKIDEKTLKKLDLSKTAFKKTIVTAKGTDGKIHEGFILTNKKGKATPLLHSLSIDMEHSVGVTTKKCLCKVIPTKKGELEYVYVNLHTGEISPTFNVAGRGHNHKYDYILDSENVIQVVNEDLTFDSTDFEYSGTLSVTDNKSYTKDSGFVVKHIPTSKYGVVSTFGVSDGNIKIFCPPTFSSNAIGHKTIGTGKYDFLYEYFSDTERVLCDTCYGLALQKVGIHEEFNVGKNIQQYRANHPLVIEARENVNKKFRDTVEKGVRKNNMSVMDRIRARMAEIKSEKSVAKVGKAVTKTTATSTTTSKHIADAFAEAYPTRMPYEYRGMRMGSDGSFMDDEYNEII